MKFPGVGVRQARRFVYYLLSRDKSMRSSLARLIETIGDHVHQCSLCGRFSADHSGASDLCAICEHPTRQSQLLIIEKDADLERIEKSGVYRGRYFVLGGIVPLSSETPEKYIRLSELTSHIKKGPQGLEEVIYGLSVTPDGEHTADIVKETLRPHLEKIQAKATHLGRGLSTGSELEYADRATIENALKGRS
jgi:recombination protein RecR